MTHKQKEYNKEYYKRNAETYRERSKKYWKENQETIKARRKLNNKNPNSRWTQLIHSCKQRKGRSSIGKFLGITKNAFLLWAGSNTSCAYCGTMELGSGSGVDRIDSTKGYIEGNLAACCKKCNLAKHEMDLDTFKDHVKRMYEQLFIKN